MVTPTTLCCSPRSQVTLAEAVPVAGSGLTLPLDLFHIAARCNGAYFASKRFAAVQVCSHQLLCCFYLKLTRVCVCVVFLLAAGVHAPALPRPRLSYAPSFEPIHAYHQGALGIDGSSLYLASQTPGG